MFKKILKHDKNLNIKYNLIQYILILKVINKNITKECLN